MLSNITSNSQKETLSTQPLLTPGDRVYLYGDTDYTGTLIRPVILRMGNRARKFRRLADIWDLLSVDEFVLSEIFAEDKLIAIELIRPPKKREKPQPLEKKTYPMMNPQDIIRNRTMFKVSSG